MFLGCRLSVVERRSDARCRLVQRQTLTKKRCTYGGRLVLSSFLFLLSLSVLSNNHCTVCLYEYWISSVNCRIDQPDWVNSAALWANATIDLSRWGVWYRGGLGCFFCSPPWRHPAVYFLFPWCHLVVVSLLVFASAAARCLSEEHIHNAVCLQGSVCVCADNMFPEALKL